MSSPSNETSTADCFTTSQGYLSLLIITCLIFVAHVVHFVIMVLYHRCHCAFRRVLGFAITGVVLSLNSLIQFAIIVAKPTSCGNQIAGVVLMSVSAFFLIIVTVVYFSKLQGTGSQTMCSTTSACNMTTVSNTKAQHMY
ncbi:uncharacterized protein LOC135463187 [Liolophura sinensis]|uniref:uncharacterized protein LOC135463187 n=1 Tax=Liolophura sinensis TaxID=3198878 RepID=UPI0031585F73